MVERYVRDVEAVGSNPVTSTKAHNKAICRVTNELEIDMLMCKPLRSYDLSGFLLLYNEYRYEYRLTKMIEENARKKCFCVQFVYHSTVEAAAKKRRWRDRHKSAIIYKFQITQIQRFEYD